MYAIPTPGRYVPMPGTRQLLPEAGQNIGPMTQYWQRRLREGDVILSDTAPVPVATVTLMPSPVLTPTTDPSTP